MVLFTSDYLSVDLLAKKKQVIKTIPLFSERFFCDSTALTSQGKEITTSKEFTKTRLPFPYKYLSFKSNYFYFFENNFGF